MRILLPTTEQSCSVETNTHGAVVSSGRRARVSICLALATVLGATASWFSHASAQGLFTEYNVPTKPGSFPLSAVTGPDGALWFVQRNSNTVGRMTTAGVVTEYAIPTVDSGPNQITLGPDGALWFTESAGNNIGRITTTGSFTEYPLPEVGSQPNPIVTGSDGNLWFGENDTITGKIGRITPAGVITEFTLPSGSSAAQTFHLSSVEKLAVDFNGSNPRSSNGKLLLPPTFSHTVYAGGSRARSDRRDQSHPT